MNRSELLQVAKPILFNTEMVRAILDEKKTVTRRIVKFLDNRNPNWTGYVKDGLTLYNGKNEPCSKPAPYKVGDILYIRETWSWCPCWDCGMDTEEGCCDETASKFYHTSKGEYGCYGYKASFDGEPFEGWHPSIHMPKEAARIFLKIMHVRVERLQDITEEQATNEGCQAGFHEYKGAIWGQKDTDEWTAVEQFQDLWNSTIKKAELDKYGWDANPWVWVIEFERVEVK